MKKIKVLVIDDSALVRQVVTEVLSSAPGLQVVGSACDPYEAREKIKALQPDVLTLDIEMPKMDGITFLKNLMKLKPMPVVMLSTLTAKGADETLKALELGAVDFIQKPVAGTHAIGEAGFASQLITKVEQAGRIKQRSLHATGSATAPLLEQAPVNRPDLMARGLIAVGASTGGPEALTQLLAALPADMPPIVIVQHIPPVFSERFAQRLNRICRLKVVEAEDGQALQAGCVYIAPGGLQMRIRQLGLKSICCVEDSAPVNLHKPSVEVLFDSIAELTFSPKVGVMLTGMGRDGAEAMLRLMQSGAHTLVQDKASSLIWGMPGAAVELGAASQVVSLDKMPLALCHHLKHFSG